MNRANVRVDDAFTSYGNIMDIDYLSISDTKITGDPSEWLHNAICNWEWAVVDDEFTAIEVRYPMCCDLILSLHSSE